MANFDPFEPFQDVRKAAFGQRKPLEGVLDAFDEEQKNKRELGLYNKKQEGDLQRSLQLERGKKQIDTEAQTELLGKLGVGGSSSGFMPESYKVGDVTYKNPEYSGRISESRNQAFVNRKKMMGAGAESGRIALAKESIKNIGDIRKILFPDGTPESFKRGVAAESNIFGGFSQPAQDVFRKAGASVSGRQLIQTGVAARPEETELLRKQFISNFKSNPAAAMSALKELEDFYTDYLNTADPSALFRGDGGSEPGISGMETDRDQIEEALMSGEYDSETIENMKRDFLQEYGVEF